VTVDGAPVPSVTKPALHRATVSGFLPYFTVALNQAKAVDLQLESEPRTAEVQVNPASKAFIALLK